MRVTIHQPNYLPWLGFFNKVSQADLLVILDSVQYEKGGFTNRNKIRISDSPAGWIWLTVPVKKGSSNQLIKDVEIDNTQKWKETSLRTFYRVYKKAPYFEEYKYLIDKIYKSDWDKICDLNIFIINEILKILNLKPQVIRSSDLTIEGKKSDLNLDICRKVGASTYLSGVSGKEYLDLASFKAAGIDVEFQDYKHPVYRQISEPFIPYMCVLDLLFNNGPDSIEIIKQ